MLWGEEVKRIMDEADGDLGLACALAALRKAENGRPGREYGVLSVPAPTYDAQLEVAANSLRNSVERFRRTSGGRRLRDRHGFFTEEFLAFFSARWAPVGAENDPTGLNRHHLPNLRAHHARYRIGILAGVARGLRAEGAEAL